MPDNDDAVTQAALSLAELAVKFRSELEDHKRRLESGRFYSHAAHEMGLLLDAITTYERRKYMP